MVTVLLSERAQEWLENVEPAVRKRIRSKLQDVTDFPDHYLDRLRGSEFYKLRVGDYRVIIDWDKTDDKLLVRRIGKRDGVYE